MNTELMIIIAFSWIVSLVWFAIRYFLKRRERKEKAISKNAKQWMDVSKFAGYLFFLLPFILIPIVWVSDYIFNILLLIPATLAVISLACKK